MNVTAELNAPYVRNDFLTARSVVRYIETTYPGMFDEQAKFAAVNKALRANDATVGCQIADSIAVKLREVRQRFASERNLRASL